MKNKFKIGDLVEIKYSGVRLFVKEFEFDLVVGCFVYGLGLMEYHNNVCTALEDDLIGINSVKPIETSKENGC